MEMVLVASRMDQYSKDNKEYAVSISCANIGKLNTTIKKNSLKNSSRCQHK